MSSECSDDIKYHNILNSSSQIGRANRMYKKGLQKYQNRV